MKLGLEAFTVTKALTVVDAQFLFQIPNSKTKQNIIDETNEVSESQRDKYRKST